MPAEIKTHMAPPLQLTVAAIPGHIRRVVFLDFDGVLHPVSATAGVRPPLSPEQIRTGWPGAFVHEEMVASHLRGHDDVGVVVTSSWRSFLDDKAIGDLLPWLEPWYCGTIGMPYRSRGVGVRAWLNAHPQVKQFCILEDQPAFFPGHWPTLFHCRPMEAFRTGLVFLQLKMWLDESAAHPRRKTPVPP